MSAYSTSIRFPSTEMVQKTLSELTDQAKDVLGPAWSIAVVERGCVVEIATDLVSVDLRIGGQKLMLRFGTAKPDSSAAARAQQTEIAVAWFWLQRHFPSMQALSNALAKADTAIAKGGDDEE